jgi:CO/xanthine dehydrogenase Mo-binding subunit
LAERRRAGEHVGAGLAYFVEKSGLGPFDDVRLELDAEGHAVVVTGVASVGQGVETSLAQIVADRLGLSHEDVHVVHGQTDRIARGMGAFATRVTVMAGNAAAIAADALRARLLRQAALLLQARVDLVTLADGIVGAGGSSVPLATVVAACLVESGEARMVEQATFESRHMTYPYGIHMAIACVDTETGGVTLERFAVAYDIGRAVNPMLVAGQIHGGVCQGVGGALLEQFIYTVDGQPLCTSFADYLMPTAAEMPTVDLLLTEDAPSSVGHLGVKGAGEGGTTAAGAAIAAAVDAALDNQVRIHQLPITANYLRTLIRAL